MKSQRTLIRVPGAAVHLDFAAAWHAEILPSLPLITPARSYTWPQEIAGEQDSLARGALVVRVLPNDAPAFVATCALGFESDALPGGVWACPDPDTICAIAGGYAYLADVREPRTATLLPQKPVTSVLAATEAHLLLLAGFHRIIAIGVAGLLWESDKLTDEGLTDLRVDGMTLRGTGWELQRDREFPFCMDLKTGRRIEPQPSIPM